MVKKYDPKVSPWQIQEEKFPSKGKMKNKINYCLRYAILAPSSHNTQPWKFSLLEDQVRFIVDKSRWLKVADADQRELHISVGCALENFLVAADHFGLGFEVRYFLEGEEGPAAIVRLFPQLKKIYDPVLFEAIPNRQTNHKIYQERQITQQELEQLQSCCTGDGIQFFMTCDPETKRKVDGLIIQADAIQFSDPAWREELGYWIGQGAFGTPWLMSKMAQLAVTYLNMSKGTAKKDSEVLMSAPSWPLLPQKAMIEKIKSRSGRSLKGFS